MNAPRSPLTFLMPGWFSIVMGLSGLALAWHRAAAPLGAAAGAVAAALALVAAAVFALLLVFSIVRMRRLPEALREDLRHPVRHAFVAAVPISALLLVTLWVALVGTGPWVAAFWWIASLSQLAVTVWVLARWWRGNQPDGLPWAALTPALIVPIVGNVLVPLAGVPLDYPFASAAQFGIGLLFWPVVLILLVARIAVAGLWPERMMPTIFITIAPPAVIGIDLLQFGAPPLLAWGAWGMALFFLLWALTQGPAHRGARIRHSPLGDVVSAGRLRGAHAQAGRAGTRRRAGDAAARPVRAGRRVGGRHRSRFRNAAGIAGGHAAGARTRAVRTAIGIWRTIAVNSTNDSCTMTVLKDETSRTDLLNRLRRAEGQLRGIQRMIEEGEECMQIAQQISAVRKALDSAYVRMTVCFMEQELSGRMREGKARAADLRQLLANVETLLGKVR